MRSSFLFYMAYRLIRGAKKREPRPIIGSILGIALSMVPLVFVIFFSQGMIRGLTDRYIETGTSHIRLQRSSKVDESLLEETLEELAEVEGLVSFWAEHGGTALSYGRGGKEQVIQLRGVRAAVYQEDQGFRRYLQVVEGRFDTAPGNAIVLGLGLSEALGVGVGDTLKVLTGKTLSTGKYIPRISRFQVVGIVSTGYQDLDRSWGFINFQKAREVLQDRNAETVINIKVQNPYGNLYEAYEGIRKTVSPYNWYLYTWMSLNYSLQSNYRTTRGILIFIMALIVVIAVLSISSSMIMMVMANEEEIGVLKSMGYRTRTIAVQYVLAGGFSGGLGSLGGILIGAFIVVNSSGLIALIEKGINRVHEFWLILMGQAGQGTIELLTEEYYLSDFVITLDYKILSLLLVVTTLLSMAVALIPIWHIKKVTVLDILRKH